MYLSCRYGWRQDLLTICHRASSIETTSGWKESLLHCSNLEKWQSRRAVPADQCARYRHDDRVPGCARSHGNMGCELRLSKREVNPTEQHLHSCLEMLPLMGLLIVVILHWHQFLS